MIIGEYLHGRNFSGHTANVLFGYTIPLWLWNAYKKVCFINFKSRLLIFFIKYLLI